MKRHKRALACITVLALVLASAGSAMAAKKIKAYTSQITHTFTNAEGGPAHGLTVLLSSQVVVETDTESGQAGPFRDVTGNSSTKIVVTNPTEPIAPATSVDLVFQSYSSKIKITNWWWTDEKGKRLGKKKKG